MPVIQGQITSANTPTAVVTVGAGQELEVFSIELHSVHSTVQTIQVFFVPNNAGVAGTAGLTNEKESFTLAAGESLTLVAPKAPWKFSGENDTVQLESSVAAVLNYVVTVAIDGGL
jgi:uncharacterized protein YjdB